MRWRPLYKTIGRSRMEYFDLLTVLSDIQNSINSRPLTYRCSSDSGLDIITPNSFLKPNVNASLWLKVDDDNIWDSDPPSQSDVLDSIQTRDHMVQKFRELWYESYLLSMREQCKDLHEVDFINHVKVDDVVLVKNPAKPRPYWLLGRVVEIISGDDGKVRSAKVKRGDGSIQLHSISHLYPLEIPLTHPHQATEPNLEVSGSEEVPNDESSSQISAADDVASDNQIPATDDVASNPSDLPNQSESDNTQPVSQRSSRLAATRDWQRSPNNPYYYY